VTAETVTAPALPAVAPFLRPAAPPLVPEIRLHVTTDLLGLWEALEAALGGAALPPPFWAVAWPGGQALARHVLDAPDLVRGRRVLDVGAGSGLAAIAAARACAHRVVAAEPDPLAVEAIGRNALLNGVAIETALGDPVADPAVPAWDVVLAGDVFYDRATAERLEPWLRALARSGVVVLVADPGRAYLPRRGLVEIARWAVPTSRDLEDRDVRDTGVYALGG
jgi:predicted nicotinamide N-methyase